MGARTPVPRVRVRRTATVPPESVAALLRANAAAWGARAAAARRRGATASGRRPLGAARVRLPRARRLHPLPRTARSHAARGRPALPELGPGRDGGRGALPGPGPGRRLAAAAELPPLWPTPSTACGAGNGSGRAAAATAPASASRASAATCSTTQFTIFSTSPGSGNSETSRDPNWEGHLNREGAAPSRARGRRWRGRSSATQRPGTPW